MAEEINTEQVRKELAMLVEYFEDLIEESKVKFWTLIAEKLSVTVGKEPPWSWRYPQGVLQGTIKPSPEFGRAVRLLATTMDDTPLVLANTEQIQVMATVGAIQPGSLVMGMSRPCANPSCRIRFVPDHPRRKYCPVCRPPRHKK